MNVLLIKNISISDYRWNHPEITKKHANWNPKKLWLERKGTTLIRAICDLTRWEQLPNLPSRSYARRTQCRHGRQRTRSSNALLPVWWHRCTSPSPGNEARLLSCRNLGRQIMFVWGMNPHFSRIFLFSVRPYLHVLVYSLCWARTVYDDNHVSVTPCWQRAETR